MAKSLARVNIDLTATNAKLTQKLKDSESKLQRYQKKSGSSLKKMRKSLNTLAAGFATLSVGAVAALAAITKASADAADQLGKTSDKLGVMPEKLQALRRAAELTGVSTTTLDMALQRMVRRVSEAAQGTGEAVGALQELGLEAETLAKLSPDEQFKRLSESMQNVAGSGDRVRLAMKLFDSEGVALVNTLKLTETELDAIEKRMIGTGEALSRFDISKMEMLNDALTNAKGATTGLKNQIAIALSPVLLVLIEEFSLFSEKLISSGDNSEEMQGKIVTAIGFVGDAVRGLTLLWDGLVIAANAVAANIARKFSTIYGAYLKIKEKITGETQAEGASPVETVADILEEQLIGRISKLGADLLEQLPSESIAEKIAEIKTKMRDAFNTDGSGEGEDGVTVEPIPPEEQPWYASLLNRFSITKKWMDKISNLESIYQKRTLTKQQKATKQVVGIQLQQANELINIAKMFVGKKKGIGKLLMAAEVAIGLASNWISTQVSMGRAFAELGPIAGAPVAASMAVLGNIRAAAIIAGGALKIGASSGGGGGSVSVGAPTPTTPAANDSVDTSFTAPEKQDITIRSTDPFTPTVIRDFIEKLDEEGVDMGYNINFVTG